MSRETFPAPRETFGRDLSWEAVRPALKAAAAGAPPSPSLHLLKRLAADGDLTAAPLSFISLAGQVVEVEKGVAPRPVLGLAVDIGTTTMVGYLMDLFTRARLSHAARKNPQARFGEDVVSRIVFAISEPRGLKRLQEALVKALNDIIEEAAEKGGASRDRIFEVAAVGNTTMHHLLLGLSPHNLTRFPYPPVIRGGFALPAREMRLAIHPEGQLYLPPLIAGFMGSDTVGAGEYNHSVPPALSNLLDHFLEEYFFRPSAIVSYSAGAYAGIRAAVQLRAMLCELGMPSIPSTFPVPRIRTAFGDDGIASDPAFDKRFLRFASELEWYGEALRERRKAGVPY